MNAERLPETIEYYGKVRPYAGPDKAVIKKPSAVRNDRPQRRPEEKLISSIAEAVDKAGLKDGMTVSFHHHLRNGDYVVNLVMKAIAEKGLKDIRLAASGIFAVHEPLVSYIKDGAITQIVTSTFSSGPVAKAVSEGFLSKPCIMMTHGGRARAILNGDLHIDVAFIAAPACDYSGNLSGTEGKSACGVLSYAYADAQCADTVIAVTDNLIPSLSSPLEIPAQQVDYIVKVDSIGDPGGIVSGTTKITTDPVRLKIAADTAQLMEEAGYIKDGMSFQTGASSTALAVAAEVESRMLKKKITGSFGLGGIHAYMVQMLEEGLFERLYDVQCFDQESARSAAENKNHIAVSGSRYASPCDSEAVVNKLDTVILGATEIDLDFNVNVTTGSNGVIMGAAGGHSDTAAGAGLAIIVANLTRKNFCVVRDRVTTITTPGETVDALVTEYGIAINPRRKDLLEKLKDSRLPLVSIEELKRKGEALVGPQTRASVTDRIVGIVEYRDGSVIDVVYRIK